MDACRGMRSLSKLKRWASSTSHWERCYPACILPFLPLFTRMLSVSQQAPCDSMKIHIGQNSHELNSVLAKERAGVILVINKPSNDDSGWILARKVCCAEERWEEGLGAMQQDLERRVGSTEGQLHRIHSRATRNATRGGLSLWVTLNGIAPYCGGTKWYNNLLLGVVLSNSSVRCYHCSEVVRDT